MPCAKWGKNRLRWVKSNFFISSMFLEHRSASKHDYRIILSPPAPHMMISHPYLFQRPHVHQHIENWIHTWDLVHFKSGFSFAHTTTSEYRRNAHFNCEILLLACLRQMVDQKQSFPNFFGLSGNYSVPATTTTTKKRKHTHTSFLVLGLQQT